MNVTVEQIARYFVENKETETANFINSKANKLYSASYRSGAYGRIFLNFIKNNYPGNINFNGCLTSVAIEITQGLESIGYSFKNENQNVNFIKN